MIMEINSIHFYVADAIKTSDWLRQKLGFQVVDRYQDADSLTIAIAYQSIMLIVSAPLSDRSPIAHYLARHAEGVADLSFRVRDLEQFQELSANQVLQPKQNKADIAYMVIRGWGILKHSLIAGDSSDRYYVLPNGKLRRLSDSNFRVPNLFHWQEVDHAVLNVAQGELTQAVNYYQELFGWQVQQTFDISTERSGLFSQALRDQTGKIQFNINEPTTQNSQIQQFLDCNRGSGIQHLALRSSNLLRDVAAMRNLGVPFLAIPLVYYLRLQKKLKSNQLVLSSEIWRQLQKQQILVDWHSNRPSAILMQIFTKPIFSQPTFFLEFIERQQQAQGFGAGNFQALFAAVEEEQLAVSDERWPVTSF